MMSFEGENHMYKRFVKDVVRKYMFNIDGAFLCKEEHSDIMHVYLGECINSKCLYLFGLWAGQNPYLSNTNILFSFTIDSTQPNLEEIIVDKICEFCELSENTE
jgi:hypothetical protein